MSMNLLYHIIIILSIAGLLLPNFVFLQEINQLPQAPETLKQAKTMGERVLQGLPQAIKEPWQEALRVWGKVFDVFSWLWNSYISPWLKNVWYKISVPFKTEMERRKPLIEEEFQKEKTEMKGEIKTEIPKTTKSLWDRFKELLR